MNKILSLQQELTEHPIYSSLTNVQAIRHFMRHHIFAVWDFMSLLKALQREITCVTHPWRPSGRPAEMVRLINQIVLGEESDLDQHGNPISHFALYLRGMNELGADTSEIHDFLSSLDLQVIPPAAREFVSHNLDVSGRGHIVEIASSFFFGREKLIPDMFRGVVSTLKEAKVQAPTFLYYLERHIEIDGDEHGPLAMKCLDYLVAGDDELRKLSLESGQRALAQRKELWDKVLASMPTHN